MSDFHQNGVVANLHKLGTIKPRELERQLCEFSKKRKITLVLPSLFSELEKPALQNILEELKGADFINHIIIGLDRANREQFEFSKNYFSVLPQKHDILWNDGPRLQEIDNKLWDIKLAPEEPGKGRNAWYCMGYALACRNSDVLALHDCDIVTYSRDMLARLIYPVANPAFQFLFTKGYYPRIGGGKLNGRVTRLLVTPLIKALKKTCGEHDYLEFLDAFRYPLAGEFAMRTAIVPNIRIPSDWGLEISLLAEVWRNLSNQSVCQVDIADVYDHKHQPLSADDAAKGLSRMSTDIAKAMFSKLATDGVVFNHETFRTIKAAYLRLALDLVEMYYVDATINGLLVDRHEEEKAVELFAANIVEAGNQFLDVPLKTAFIPNWSRVQAADPDLMRKFREAVYADKE